MARSLDLRTLPSANMHSYAYVPFELYRAGGCEDKTLDFQHASSKGLIPASRYFQGLPFHECVLGQSEACFVPYSSVARTARVQRLYRLLVLRAGFGQGMIALRESQFQSYTSSPFPHRPWGLRLSRHYACVD